MEQWCCLLLHITTFEWKGNAFLNLDDDARWVTDVNTESAEEDEMYYSKESNDNVPESMLETRLLALPSSLAPGEIEWLRLGDLAGQEAALQRGQINDALEGLQMALGEKSLLFRTSVRNAKSQRTSLRSW